MSINSKQSQSNKTICNAFGCLEPATENISVDAGTYGKIDLSICKNCIGLFKENEKISSPDNTNTSECFLTSDF